MQQRKGKAFLKLQAEWYLKIKQSGFEDIEDVKSPNEFIKVWHSSYFQTRYSPNEFEEKREYYDRARAFLEDQMQGLEYILFGKQLERTIWELHSEGLSLREIAREVGVNKDKVQNIVKRVSGKVFKNE